MLRPCDSEEILSRLGYSFESYREEPSEPEISNVRADEVVPGLKKLRGVRLYRHQVESIEAIEEGKNVILVAGTGSGKTEAWALAAIRAGLRVLAVYPTLALSADQLRRLKEYFSELGLPEAVVKVDSRTVKEIRDLSEVKIVATNPAFLMQDLKRIAERRGYLRDFLRQVDLLVFDELDFYGSHGTSVIMGMIEIISMFKEKPPQVVLLTATLGNAEAVAKLLEDITGRETVIITGKPFKVENRGYVVLAKDLEKLWRKVKEKKGEILRKVPEVKDALLDFKIFKENVFAVIEALRSKGIKVPSPSMDYAEIIAQYALCKGDGLTLVFVPSVKQAEKLLSEVRQKLPPHLQNTVASHHYMVDKKRREEIEERARKGEMKIIISPKTLAQGIDIGHVVRVVHVGLPETVREFKQREGRKGRRGDIEFTETIILPYRQWDRKLLKYGTSTLLEWAKMDLEKLYVDVNNDWVRMFTGLWKALVGQILREDERELLERLGLLKGDEVTAKGKEVWRNLGFYEYGPPYGFARYLIKGGVKKRLEEIGRRALVEYYQPGSFDYSADAVVVEINEEGIIEMPLNEATKSYRWAFEAVQQYYSIKSKWGETWTTPEKDYKFGKLTSKVELLVRPPKGGFGKLVEEPLGVKWIVESAKAEVKKVGKNFVPIYEREEVPLDVQVYGRYEDYTYGKSYSLDPKWDEWKLEAAMAYALAVLRVQDALDITEIMFAVTGTFQKELAIWEAQASGLLKSLDWREVAEKIRRHRHDKLTELIALMVNHSAINEYLKKGNWESLKKEAEALARELAGESIKVLKKLSEVEPVEERASYVLIDGNEVHILRNGEVKTITISKPPDMLKLIDLFKDTVVFFEPENTLEKFLRKHPLVFSEFLRAATKGKVINLYRALKRELNLDSLSLKAIAEALGMEPQDVKDYLVVMEEAYKRFKALRASPSRVSTESP